MNNPLKEFRSLVASDTSLQEAVAANFTPEAIVSLGAANGYEFSTSDVQAGMTEAGDLNDFELSLVSGGMNSGNCT